MPNAREVAAACAALHAAMQADGARVVGPGVVAAGIGLNGIVLGELDLEGLRAALVGLVQTLANEAQTVIVLPVHREVWAWCGQVCLFSGRPPFDEHDYHLQELAVATVRARLATAGPIAGGQDPNSVYLLMDAPTIASYLPYPLLEGLVKKHCADYVAPDGMVRVEFAALDGDGDARTYRPPRARCSNLGHLLQLLYETAAPVLRDDLQQVFEFIAPGREKYQACNEIFAWRNGSMHGETNTPAGSAVVLQIALLLLLHLIADGYEARRAEAQQEARDATEHRHVNPYSFYPHR